MNQTLKDFKKHISSMPALQSLKVVYATDWNVEYTKLPDLFRESFSALRHLYRPPSPSARYANSTALQQANQDNAEVLQRPTFLSFSVKGEVNEVKAELKFPNFSRCIATINDQFDCGRDNEKVIIISAFQHLTVGGIFKGLTFLSFDWNVGLVYESPHFHAGMWMQLFDNLVELQYLAVLHLNPEGLFEALRIRDFGPQLTSLSWSTPSYISIDQQEEWLVSLTNTVWSSSQN